MVVNIGISSNFKKWTLDVLTIVILQIRDWINDHIFLLSYLTISDIKRYRTCKDPRPKFPYPKSLVFVTNNIRKCK